MEHYSTARYLLGESVISRDSEFVSELIEETKNLLSESTNIISDKLKNVDASELEEFEKQISEIRYIRSKLLDILKVS